MVQHASLRLATHNVNGLAGPGRAARAARLWQALRLDVVAVQETHLSVHTVTRAEQALRACGFRAIWNHGAGSAGVALVVRQRLLSSGELTLVEAAARRPWPGRLLHVAASWAGHDLQLASVYMPSGDPAAQRRAVSAYLVPLARLPGEHLWGGTTTLWTTPPWTACGVGGPGTRAQQRPGGPGCRACKTYSAAATPPAGPSPL